MATRNAESGLNLTVAALYWERRLSRTAARDFAALAGFGIVSAMAAVAVTLVARRCSGALESPLPGAWLPAVGVVAASAMLVARMLLARAFPHGMTRRLQVTLLFVPPALLVAIGAALSLPGAGSGSLAAFWSVLLAEEAWSFRHAAAALRESKPRVPQKKPAPRRLPEPDALDGTLTQQLTRVLTADGTETLSGRVRLVFAEGQRVLSAHVAFCPPFVRTPQFEFRQASGPSARVKLGQLLPYGARLELKLTVPGPATVELDFAATLSPLAPGP